jgi:hypothetical protein
VCAVDSARARSASTNLLTTRLKTTTADATMATMATTAPARPAAYGYGKRRGSAWVRSSHAFGLGRQTAENLAERASVQGCLRSREVVEQQLPLLRADRDDRW